MGYFVEQVEAKNLKSKLIGIWEKNLPEWSKEKFAWHFEDNPFPLPKVWILKEDENNTIVGASTIFVRVLRLNGKMICVGNSGDFAINPEHRFLAPALKLHKSINQDLLNGEIKFIFGMPNRNAWPVKSRVGYKLIGNTEEFLMVLDSGYYFQRKFKNKYLAKSAGLAANLYLSFKRLGHLFTRMSSFNYGLVNQIDDRFDALWEKFILNSSYNLGERTKDYLIWRFQKCPLKEYYIFTLRSKDESSVLGYVIYYLQENEVKISDFLGLDLNLLFISFIRHLRVENISKMYVHFFGNSKISKTLQKLGFRSSGEGTKIITFKLDSQTGEIDQKQRWYLTEADIDE